MREIWVKGDNGELLATLVGNAVNIQPGADRELVAFMLFQAMMRLMSQGVSVTWGQAWMSGNMGSPTSPGS